MVRVADYRIEGGEMIGNWCKMTTTTASGTSAVAGLTEVTGYPTVDELFPTNNVFCWYVILNASDQPLEAGVGKKTSATNIDRVKVSKTFTGGIYDDTDPTALTLVTSTEYHVIISPIDGAIQGSMPGISTTWGYKAILSAHLAYPSTSTLAITDDRQWLMPFELKVGGVVKGFAFAVTAAAANTYVQCGLYALDHNGEPATLLARTADVDTFTASGRKTPACVTNVWVPPGWYAISIASKDAVAALSPTLNSLATANAGCTPWGIETSDIRASIGALYKANAAWTDLADVVTSSGWTSVGAASNVPIIALVFE